jgi:ribosomal protein S18 acetylase RimI-like enzyme
MPRALHELAEHYHPDVIITISAAGPSDIPSLLASADALIRTDAAVFDADATNVAWAMSGGAAYCAALVAAGDDFALLARDEGQVIGHIVGRRYGPNELHPIITAELESIYVYPAHRGRGVGGLLVRSFLERVAGVDRVTVSAYAQNTRALSFYTRLGFKVSSVILDLDL